MSDPNKITYVEVRAYLQEGGSSYRAVATVERGDKRKKAEFSHFHAEPGDAIVEALQMAGLEEGGES
jgi:hypothetical protein